MKILRAVFPILLMACPVLSATTFNVSSVQELKALKPAPGDVVVWQDGCYDAVSVKFTAHGVKDNPIVLKAQTPGGVVFTGASSISLGGEYVAAEGFSFRNLDTSVKSSILICAKGSNECRFSDCLVDGTTSECSKVDSKWVSLYGTNNEVSHCSFFDKRNMGTLLVVWMEDGVVPSHRILNNSFTRPYTHYDEKGGASNGQETIRIGTSTFSLNKAGCLVDGNYFHECHGEKAEIVSSKSCGNIYRRNLFEASSGSLTLRHGNGCTVEDNIFVGGGIPDAGGVRIVGENHVVRNNIMLSLKGKGYKAAICTVKGEEGAALNGYWQVKNLQVLGNTIAGCREPFSLDQGTRPTQTLCGVKVRIKGNKVLDNASDAPDCSARIESIKENAGIRW